MSIWYDSNGKAYASDGNNGWTQKYIDKRIDSMDGELQAHFSGAGHRHGAEDVDYGSGETVKDVLDSKAPTDHSSDSTEYGSATTALYGHVKLSDSVTSPSSANGGTAATPSAVKSAYDKAQSAEDQAQSALDTLNSKADKVTNGGFVAGNNASNTSGGVAIGNYAKVTGAGAAIGSEAEAASGFSGGYNAKSNGMGAAVGNSASSFHGGAVGYAANTSTGGAIGSEAKSTNGGAIGWEAVAGDGAAIGKTAKTVDSNNNAIDAIQLGTGTNNTAKTMQVYDKRIVEADGSLTDVGNLAELDTRAKSNIVNAINSLLNTGSGNVSQDDLTLALSIEFFNPNAYNIGIGNITKTGDKSYKADITLSGAYIKEKLSDQTADYYGMNRTYSGFSFSVNNSERCGLWIDIDMLEQRSEVCQLFEFDMGDGSQIMGNGTIVGYLDAGQYLQFHLCDFEIIDGDTDNPTYEIYNGYDHSVIDIFDVIGVYLSSKAETDHASALNIYGLGNDSNYGHVKLSDSTSSTNDVSGGTAATPAAVKAAYDKAVAASAANDFSTAKKEIGSWVSGQSIWRVPVNITNAKTSSYVTLSGTSMYFDIDGYFAGRGIGGANYKVFSVNIVCNDAEDNYCYTPLYINMKAAYFADSDHPQCYQQINSFGGSIIGYIDVVDMS